VLDFFARAGQKTIMKIYLRFPVVMSQCALLAIEENVTNY